MVIGTLKTTNEIINKYNLKAKKKFGQNFLVDENIIDKIVSSSVTSDNTLAIEIGPGIGALTEKLCMKAKQVISFEIDESLSTIHNEYLTIDNLDIIYDDFLNVDIKALLEKDKNRFDSIIVVANLPYYITTKLIEKICLSDSGISKVTVMIQKEVAEKLTGLYRNPLTIMLNDIGELNYNFTVSSNVFIPKPHVDSAVISICINKSVDLELYNLMNQSFKQKRKTIYNNLNACYENVNDALIRAGVEKNKRAEELTCDDFKRIQKELKCI